MKKTTIAAILTALAPRLLAWLRRQPAKRRHELYLLGLGVAVLVGLVVLVVALVVPSAREDILTAWGVLLPILLAVVSTLAGANVTGDDSTEG